MSNSLKWISDNPYDAMWLFAFMAFPFGAVFRVILLSTPDKSAYTKIEGVGCIIAFLCVASFFFSFFGVVFFNLDQDVLFPVGYIGTGFCIGAMLGAELVKKVYQQLEKRKSNRSKPTNSPP